MEINQSKAGRIAVVLRGPPCTGKSSVGRKLATYLDRSSTLILLDDGWRYGERRYVGAYRYSDLISDKRVLVIELGLGEPSGMEFPGATLCPDEWVRVLESEGRRLFFFQLIAPEDVLISRARDREGNWPEVIRGSRKLYGHRGICSTEEFLARLDGRHSENVVEVGARDVGTVVDLLLQKIDEAQSFR